MDITNVYDLPVADNVCAQVLREVERQPAWSMAHVMMNPLAESLVHSHYRTKEIYVITKGFGELTIGYGQQFIIRKQAAAGKIELIIQGMYHLLRNKAAGRLEHLVLALPPFDPADICLTNLGLTEAKSAPLSLPEAQDCFDGSKILPYPFPHLGLSIAFGWVSNNPASRKKPHCHHKTMEYIFVVEGEGFIETANKRRPIRSGDWIRIELGEEHCLCNEKPEDLIIVCVCCPQFRMDDVILS